MNLSNLIKIKNKYRREFQKHRNFHNNLKYGALQYFVNRKQHEWKNNCWNKTLTKLSPQKGNLWKIKKYIGKPHHNIPPLKFNLNSIAFTDIDKANVLANHFESIHTKNHNMGLKCHNKLVEKTVKNFQKKM